MVCVVFPKTTSEINLYDSILCFFYKLIAQTYTRMCYCIICTATTIDGDYYLYLLLFIFTVIFERPRLKPHRVYRPFKPYAYVHDTIKDTRRKEKYRFFFFLFFLPITSRIESFRTPRSDANIISYITIHRRMNERTTLNTSMRSRVDKGKPYKGRS